MTIKLNEAIALSEVNGNKILKKDLAKKLWPNSAEVTQQVNMRCLCSGITKRIEPDWVNIICAELGCDANFLFGQK